MELQTLDFDAAVDLMRRTEDPDVFTDRGWGDQPLEITIISCGDGQSPLAKITQETLDRMKREKVVGPNCLRTHKARKLYPYISA